jgi:hypothetical protein
MKYFLSVFFRAQQHFHKTMSTSAERQEHLRHQVIDVGLRNG